MMAGRKTRLRQAYVAAKLNGAGLSSELGRAVVREGGRSGKDL